jgi:hypothetical protein
MDEPTTITAEDATYTPPSGPCEECGARWQWAKGRVGDWERPHKKGCKGGNPIPPRSIV